jgi:CubicO group peptidase (beta-lactamase class C family)
MTASVIAGSVAVDLDAFLQRETDAARFTGAVLVAVDGGVVLQRGYGFADHAAGRPNDGSQLYKIGSLTKAFVALGMLLLEERGRLKTTDTLDRYLPDAPHADAVTLHQLLNHTSGLWCYLQDPDSPFWAAMDRLHTPEELLAYMNGHALLFEPGARWQYCNSSYVLLGIAIERLTGRPLGEFLRDEIFRPLGLTHTAFDPTETAYPGSLAIGYDLLAEAPHRVARNLHASVAYATGAMVSTVADLYAWERALDRMPLVSQSSMTRMFTPGLGNYGYGWWIDSLDAGGRARRHIWHWGCSSGYHGILTRLVDDRITVILLQNMTSPDLYTPATPFALFRLRDGILSTLFR